MRIRPCGDSMLLVEFEPVIDPVVNERAIALARGCASGALAAFATSRPGMHGRRPFRSAADRPGRARTGDRDESAALESLETIRTGADRNRRELRRRRAVRISKRSLRMPAVRPRR